MITRNAILVVSIGKDGKLEYSLPSFYKYADKVNADVVIITESEYNLNSKFQSRYNYLTFEKNQIFKYFNRYEKILRLDSDTIITPNAPNYFELDPSYLYVGREDVGSRRSHRLNQITKIKKALGDIPTWNEFYFNSGVILASSIHKGIFDISDIDFNKDLGEFKEQNVVNWKANYLNLKIKDLGKNFNYTRIYEDSNPASGRLKADIIHYAGPQFGKEKKMQSDFNKLFV